MEDRHTFEQFAFEEPNVETDTGKKTCGRQSDGFVVIDNCYKSTGHLFLDRTACALIYINDIGINHR